MGKPLGKHKNISWSGHVNNSSYNSVSIGTRPVKPLLPPTQRSSRVTEEIDEGIYEQPYECLAEKSSEDLYYSTVTASRLVTGYKEHSRGCPPPTAKKPSKAATIHTQQQQRKQPSKFVKLFPGMKCNIKLMLIDCLSTCSDAAIQIGNPKAYQVTCAGTETTAHWDQQAQQPYSFSEWRKLWIYVNEWFHWWQRLHS